MKLKAMVIRNIKLFFKDKGMFFTSLVTPMILLVLYVTFLGKMLMYGKEASNRKQEIDCQHHTIPNQRPKDKHYGNVHNRLWNHG